MSDWTPDPSDDWRPVHHEEADEPEAPKPAAKPREAKPKEPGVSMMLSVPPEVMQQLYSLSATMEKISWQMENLIELLSKRASPDAGQEKVTSGLTTVE